MDDVVVVGAGPTGLTVAIELARRGVGVRVVDGIEAPHRGSRGKGMQPRTLELLDQLGVADRLVALGRSAMVIREHEADGTVRDVVRDTDTAPGPTMPWSSSMLVPQWRTEQVLRERLAQEGVAVEYGRRVTALTQDERHDGPGVTLTVEDGSEIRAAWVIGADGGSSAVRHALGVGFLGETHEEARMLLGDVEIDGLDRDHWHMWSAPGPLVGTGAVFVALCPLPASPTWQLQIAHSDPGLLASHEVFEELVGALGPRIRLRRTEVATNWRLNVRMVDDYRVGRVFLAGDAAHVHSPAGGQGMNTGIGDAVNLGWKLAAVVRGAAGDDLLDSYTTERLPVAAAVIGLSNALTRERFWARTADQVRDSRGFGITYRGGPLAPDDDGPGLRPGERAPDAPLAGATTLFARRRDADFTALAFGGTAPAPDVPGSVQVLDADALDVDGVLRATYAPEEHEMIVIRPDGHLWSRSGARTPARA